VKIQYEFTVDDMADVMRRAVKRRRLWLTWRWRLLKHQPNCRPSNLRI
jgi:hypothetical protein